MKQPPIRQPQPFWQKATDVRLLGRSGNTLRVSFFDPSTPAWFEAWIDTRTYHTIKLDMIAAAHFMHDTYGPFDAALQITPLT